MTEKSNDFWKKYNIPIASELVILLPKSCKNLNHEKETEFFIIFLYQLTDHPSVRLKIWKYSFRLSSYFNAHARFFRAASSARTNDKNDYQGIILHANKL